MENELKQIIKFALFNTDVPSSFTLEDELIKELEQQTMLSVLGTNVDQLPFSDKNQAYCINYIMGCFAFTHELMYEQSQLVDLLQQNGIALAIFKGSAAAMNYPEPAYRTSGDVDSLVREADFQKAYELLKNNGYTLSYDEDHVDYHYTLKKENITFELHKYPAGLPDGESGKNLMGILNAGLSAVDTAEIEGYQVPVLPTVANGLVLLLHIRKLLTGGLGLRQIADWMMFVDKHLDDVAWESEFKSILSRSGLDTLAKTVTRMCQIHLGLRQEITWCADACEPVKRKRASS